MENVFVCHLGSIAAMALNRTGDLLATASEKGTIVRLWRVNQDKPPCIGNYRRGADKAEINDIQFSSASNFLSVSSDHNTIHIFEVDKKATGENANQNIAEDDAKEDDKSKK